jgi:DNA-binding response OmpR family regulator
MASVITRPLLLLVEDHTDTREMYAEFLAPSFDVIGAANAEQALGLMRERVPALVITDMSLPGIDGFELTRRMRADRSTEGVPVICLSGYGGLAHERRAREVGCDRILEKPCAPDLLARIAQELDPRPVEKIGVLKRRSARSASRRQDQRF